MIKILEEDLIESRSELQKTLEEKNTISEAKKDKDAKILELENIKE